MLDRFGKTQKQLLRFLHRQKKSMTVDHAAQELKITRTATKQHVDALENLGYLEKGKRNLTGGRPSQSFQISEKGAELFPKQYSWFSELMLKAIREEKGSEGLKDWLRDLASSVAKTFSEELAPLTPAKKIHRVSELMTSLHYDAELTSKPNRLPEIQASNCVFHALAKQYPEVCEFDVELLKKLTNTSVSHETCMVKGSQFCRFSFSKQHQMKKTTAE